MKTDQKARPVIHAVSIGIMVSFFSIFSGKAMAKESPSCGYLEIAIENLLVDSMLKDQIENYESPLGNLHGGLISRWSIFINNMMGSHRALDCDMENLIAIFEKVPSTRKMGGSFLFVDGYYNANTELYELPDKSDEGDATPSIVAQSSPVVEPEIAPSTLDLVPQTPFRLTDTPEKYTSALEILTWRVESKYLGRTIVPHPARQVVVLVGCSLRVVNSKGELVGEIDIEGCASHAAGFSKDGKRFAYQNDGKLVVGEWAGTELQTVVSCNGHTRNILELKFGNENGSELFTTSDDGTTRAWDLTDNGCTETARYRFGGYDTALSSEGFAYFIDHDAKTLKKIDLKTGAITTVGGRWGSSVARIFYHDASGKLFGGGLILEGDAANIFQIDTQTGQAIQFTQTGSSVGSAFDEPHKVAVSDDGRFIAYVRGYSGNQVYMIDTQEKREFLQFEGISRDAEHIAFIPGTHDFIISNNESFGGEAIYWQIDLE